ncbi:MAG: hypothetical protein DCC75_04325 [Proteobacteria bacterium]|nr:MAG: hypothetical protein DCC75_04325 [Pseudomonadota bacterium]
MLIRSTGQIETDFYLLTLGSSCHYVLKVPQRSGYDLILFDPGTSAHVAGLASRLKQLGLDPERVSSVYLTHLHPERVSGVPYLKKYLDSTAIYISRAMQTQLKDSALLNQLYQQDLTWRASFPAVTHLPQMNLEEYRKMFETASIISDSELIRLTSDYSIRAIPLAGHTQASIAYQVLPHHYLIVDETFGYYFSRGLSSPGCDLSISAACESLRRAGNFEVEAICLPFCGTLVGDLVRKHLTSLLENSADLEREVNRALAEKIETSIIINSIQNSFYNSDSPDPVLRESMARTFKAICAQFNLNGDATN